MTKKQYLDSITEWSNVVTPTGIKYGYPHCCIHAFAHQSPEVLKNVKSDETDKARFDASKIDGEYTGFIPCYYHARQILSGRMTLKSLIKNRDKSLQEFPKDWSLK